MEDAERLKLLHAPYAVPKVHRGDELLDVARGEYIKVGGYTSAPIPWPRILKTGKHAPIVTEELARAVRTESEISVAHHWGVCVVTVWSWRKKLGVPQINEGTKRLYEDYSPEKLTEEVAELGRERAASPESAEKIRLSKIGKVAHPNTAAALQHAASLRKPKSHRRAIGRANMIYWLRLMPPVDNSLVRAVVQYRKLAPPPSRGVAWNSCEEALLGLGPDRVIAGILGRSKASVQLHRHGLHRQSFKQGRHLIGLQGKIAKIPQNEMSDVELSELFGVQIEPT